MHAIFIMSFANNETWSHLKKKYYYIYVVTMSSHKQTHT